ncbi:Metallo-hydrolase/oxidoreductase [Trichoderma ceciliae]
MANLRNSVPPTLDLPKSDSTASVSLIDTGIRIRAPVSVFLMPSISGHEYIDCPAFSFLIENKTTGRRLLFDLGMRADWENLSPTIVQMIKRRGFEMAVKGCTNVSQVLESEGVALNSIEGVVWSHWHFDHTGDISAFPSSTALIVGPGFKKSFLPGFPENQDGVILETDYRNRDINEIDFHGRQYTLSLGRFKAFDYFGDGSFYLLDGPGHAIGHMCALARTTPTTFVFLGGDTCHHGGEFRPSEHRHLPEIVHLQPYGTTCPGSLFEQSHPKKSRKEPFYTVAVSPTGEGVAADANEARETVSKMQDFDASDDVFTVIAHDDSLLGIVDSFPKNMNDWKAKGWAKKGRWAFLKDFRATTV